MVGAGRRPCRVLAKVSGCGNCSDERCCHESQEKEGRREFVSNMDARADIREILVVC